jgi:hypothetical protein
MTGFVKISGKLVGAETVAREISTLEKTLREKLKIEIAAQAGELLGLAQSFAPVKSGALRASIRAYGEESKTAIISTVGTDVFYGKFQESGWTPNPRSDSKWRRNPRNAKGWRAYMAEKGGRKIYSHPFLKPAIGKLRGRFRDRLVTLTASMDL